MELGGARQLARPGLDTLELLHRRLVMPLSLAQNIRTWAQMKKDHAPLTKKKPREVSFGASPQLGVPAQHGSRLTAMIGYRKQPFGDVAEPTPPNKKPRRRASGARTNCQYHCNYKVALSARQALARHVHKERPGEPETSHFSSQGSLR